MLKAILIISYLAKEGLEAYVDYLDDAHMKSGLPENVKDVYDEEEYRKWQAYRKDRSRLDLAGTLMTVAISLLLFAFNIHSVVFRHLEGLGILGQYAAFIFLFSLLADIVSLPFSYFRVFVVEEKYGMNKSTRATFILDHVKSFIIGIVLAFMLMAIIIGFYGRYGNAGLIFITIAIMLLSLLLNLLSMPLMMVFNKFSPLEDGELKDKLLSLCDKYDVEVKRLVVRDASRRTTKANAFCTGLGKKKTISLDDNLVDGFEADQITAVFAHEFAHARYRHILKSLPLLIFRQALTIAFFGLVLNIPQLFEAFGFDGMNYYFAMTLLEMVSWPLSLLLDILYNQASRKHEYEADAFAATEGYGGALIAALKKLNKESLSDINPHPLAVRLRYSHPTLSQRIDAIEKAGTRRNPHGR